MVYWCRSKMYDCRYDREWLVCGRQWWGMTRMAGAFCRMFSAPQRMAIIALILLGCQSSAPAPASPPRQETVSLYDTDEDVKIFCGACHRLPEPQSFAVADWREKVVFGYRMHQESGRTDLHPPPREYVVAYYQNRRTSRTHL